MYNGHYIVDMVYSKNDKYKKEDFLERNKNLPGRLKNLNELEPKNLSPDIEEFFLYKTLIDKNLPYKYKVDGITLENIATTYKNRYEENANNNVYFLAAKESLDHYVSYMLLNNREFINSEEFECYLTYISEIAKDDPLEYSTNVVFETLSIINLNKKIEKTLKDLENLKDKFQTQDDIVSEEMKKQASSMGLDLISEINKSLEDFFPTVKSTYPIEIKMQTLNEKISKFITLLNEQQNKDSIESIENQVQILNEIKKEFEENFQMPAKSSIKKDVIEIVIKKESTDKFMQSKINKMDSDILTNEDIELLAKYFDSKRDLNDPNYEKFFKYIFNNLENLQEMYTSKDEITGEEKTQIPIKLLSSILSYTPKIYGEKTSNYCRTFIGKVDSKPDSFTFTKTNTNISRSYIFLNLEDFKNITFYVKKSNTEEKNIFPSIEKSRAYENPDILLLLWIQFHELTHLYQKDSRLSEELAGWIDDLLNIFNLSDNYPRNIDYDELQELYSSIPDDRVGEFKWNKDLSDEENFRLLKEFVEKIKKETNDSNSSISNKGLDNYYKLNHDSDEVEISADEKAWQTITIFVYKYLRKYNPNLIMQQLIQNIAAIDARRIFSHKIVNESDEGSLGFQFDLTKIQEILKTDFEEEKSKKEDEVSPTTYNTSKYLKLIFNEDGSINPNILFNNYGTYTTINWEVSNYILDNNMNEIKNIILAGDKNQHEVESLISNFERTFYENTVKIERFYRTITPSGDKPPKILDFTYSDTDSNFNIRESFLIIYQLWLDKTMQQFYNLTLLKENFPKVKTKNEAGDIISKYKINETNLSTQSNDFFLQNYFKQLSYLTDIQTAKLVFGKEININEYNNYINKSVRPIINKHVQDYKNSESETLKKITEDMDFFFKNQIEKNIEKFTIARIDNFTKDTSIEIKNEAAQIDKKPDNDSPVNQINNSTDDDTGNR